MTQIFTADQFTPSRFSAAEDKAKFANHFVRFVDSGFKRTLFHKWFYVRLSMCFGHIAHYNRHGFYGHFFEGHSSHETFMAHLQRPIYGDPEYTYSDVERALAAYYRGRKS